MVRLFIGYDAREAVVYHVCVNSIIRQASLPLSVTPLALRNLPRYAERHRLYGPGSPASRRERGGR